MEVKHLSTQRKIKQNDSLSSGERKGKSLNRILFVYKFYTGSWENTPQEIRVWSLTPNSYFLKKSYKFIC